MNDYETIDDMKEIMWKFPLGSIQYKSAQKTLAFLCNRIRSEQKIELFYPAIGSMEEKMDKNAEEVLLEN